MSVLSRRSLVTTVAAMPTLAVPAIVIAAPAELDDPIYAANSLRRWPLRRLASQRKPNPAVHS
jgi:hypothetical protein